VAIQAGLGAFVVVFREIALMQLIDFIGATCVGVAVIDIDDAVAVDVFVRVSNTVIVEVPASLPV